MGKRQHPPLKEHVCLEISYFRVCSGMLSDIFKYSRMKMQGEIACKRRSAEGVNLEKVNLSGTRDLHWTQLWRVPGHTYGHPRGNLLKDEFLRGNSQVQRTEQKVCIYDTYFLLFFACFGHYNHKDAT
ncbi:hypothetical protein J2Z66_005180 [Paenibacillus eucommiae]|uniref:Uncharacterized protein n=1 Tax=Paenibacillus eucommiae TaxID=1355755 RepID=A0ABS4J152_9BACL|nr:hypothetical protein [Paenibacillus eucommiae]